MSSYLKVSLALCHPHWQAVAGDGSDFINSICKLLFRLRTDVQFRRVCAPLYSLLANLQGESGCLGEGGSLWLFRGHSGRWLWVSVRKDLMWKTLPETFAKGESQSPASVLVNISPRRGALNCTLPTALQIRPCLERSILMLWWENISKRKKYLWFYQSDAYIALRWWEQKVRRSNNSPASEAADFHISPVTQRRKVLWFTSECLHPSLIYMRHF